MGSRSNKEAGVNTNSRRERNGQTPRDALPVSSSARCPNSTSNLPYSTSPILLLFTAQLANEFSTRASEVAVLMEETDGLRRATAALAHGAVSGHRLAFSWENAQPATTAYCVAVSCLLFFSL